MYATSLVTRHIYYYKTTTTVLRLMRLGMKMMKASGRQESRIIIVINPSTENHRKRKHSSLITRVDSSPKTSPYNRTRECELQSRATKIYFEKRIWLWERDYTTYFASILKFVNYQESLFYNTLMILI